MDMNKIFQNKFGKKAFHVIGPFFRKVSPKYFKLLCLMKTYYSSNLPQRPCHLYELFIRHNGDVYPCCRVWTNNELRIGNIDDRDLPDKIITFNKYCLCKRYKMRKALPDEEIRCQFLHLELSLACQATCIMCCVHSPSWRGQFNNYDSLKRIIQFYRPHQIQVQGGEILIQKKSLEWLIEIKREYPEIQFSIVTNGHVDLDMIELVEELFSTGTISIVGFQAETYKKIMGIEFDKTIRFVEELNKRKQVKVSPYFLITPLNIHEANLFLDWAININPASIFFADSNVVSYLKMNTSDNYWNKVIERTAKDIKQKLLEHKSKLLENTILVKLDFRTKELFGIDDDFIIQNGFEEIIYCEEL